VQHRPERVPLVLVGGEAGDVVRRTGGGDGVVAVMASTGHDQEPRAGPVGAGLSASFVAARSCMSSKYVPSSPRTFWRSFLTVRKLPVLIHQLSSERSHPRTAAMSSGAWPSRRWSRSNTSAHSWSVRAFCRFMEA